MSALTRRMASTTLSKLISAPPHSILKDITRRSIVFLTCNDPSSGGYSKLTLPGITAIAKPAQISAKTPVSRAITDLTLWARAEAEEERVTNRYHSIV